MKKIAIAVLLSAIVAPAVAADMYVGVNAGSAKIDSPDFDSSSSFALLGGYTFNENVAAEIAYSNFGSESGLGITSKSSAVSISGVGSFPFNEQFSLFGKLGFASTTLDVAGVSDSKSDLTYGFGGQFNVNKQIGIRVGYDVYKVGSVNSVDQKVTSVGGVFKF
jgi:OmpA-OmpF porin, OOP family